MARRFSAAGSGPVGKSSGTGRRFGGLLWQRDFRLFWFGETVNQVGSAMAVVAVPLLAVITLHASVFEVGALAAAAYAPWPVIGLPAGAWVDRVDCRKLMIICDLISLGLYASVPLAWWAGALTIGQLLGVQFLAGAANVLFGTAYQVNLPALVASDDLVEANAQLQGSSSAASLGGRGLAGLVVQAAGAATALLANAVSFGVSATCLVAINTRTPWQRCDRPRAPATLRQQITEGLALVFRDPYLRPLSVFGGVANLALDGYGAIIVVYMVRVVGLNAASVGLLLAVPGIGGIAGALIARRFAAAVGSSRALLLSAVVGLPFALLVPLTGPGFRLVFYLAGVFVAAIGVAVTNIIIASFRQVYCAEGTLGRVTATMRLLILGTSPLGALAGGALGTWLGLRPAMWITIAVLAGSGTLLLTRSFVTSRELPARPAIGRSQGAGATEPRQSRQAPTCT